MKQHDKNHKEKPKKSKKKLFGIGTGVIIITVIVLILISESSSVNSTNMEPIGPLVLHIHPHLKIVVHGESIPIPANIGLDPALWKDHSLAIYSDYPRGESPLHTHDTSGTIHVESTVKRDYTLGEFFNVWGVDFSGYKVVASVDGNPISDYRNHVLKDGEQIELDITKE